MKATVLPYQSLIDVAVSATGDAETAYDIALMNGLPLSAEPEYGTVLDAPAPKSQTVATYYKHNPQPATGLTPDTPTMDGISHMVINGDFIVGKE
ncbi:MAG: hypothetical protein J6T96_12135 [Bacteroidales bacterium]|nr:hypothetical protein [Bacteroidales bacterium]MBO7566607.1 hypothetical protein [Bacteroidales bacterium]